MHEKINQVGKKTEVFHHLNPYDLITIFATFDDREITPPRTYFPAINPEQQLKSVTDDLIKAFGAHLLFVGLSGSRANDSDKQDRDLDVLAIVDDDAVENKVSFEGDLKIVSHSGLRESIECGYSLITGQFRKAVPLFEQDGVLDDLRSLKPVLEKAIPFLVTKSKFSEQTADIFRLMSNKYRAIILYKEGYRDEAFSQLTAQEHDRLFQSLSQSVDPNVYTMLAKYYANLGLNRMYHSLSEMLHALYIKEMGDVLDVDQLLDWALQRMGESGALFKYIYEKRVACYKRGELLLDIEYDMMREGIREKNRVVANMILNR